MEIKDKYQRIYHSKYKIVNIYMMMIIHMMILEIFSHI